MSKAQAEASGVDHKQAQKIRREIAAESDVVISNLQPRDIYVGTTHTGNPKAEIKLPQMTGELINSIQDKGFNFIGVRGAEDGEAIVTFEIPN